MAKITRKSPHAILRARELASVNEIALVSDLSDLRDDYFGVCINQGHGAPSTGPFVAGFITRIKYADGEYTVSCMDGITRGNGWDSWDDKSLHGIIGKLLEAKHRVFMFNDPVSLLDWLRENPRE